MNMLFWGLDPTYVLIILAFAVSAFFSARMNATFSKYSQVNAASGLTGAQAAQRILQSAGIYDVTIEHVSGKLTDHYDPSHKVLRLSQSVYGSTSIAAIGVAAHECGHAVQDARNYVPLKVRSAIVPVANFGSQLSWPLFLVGLIFSWKPLVTAGIVLFCGALIFQIVTLPVELNASGRALKMLNTTGILGDAEIKGTRRVLTAAAMTYVAAVIGSLLQLLRLLILSGGVRNRDD
ncbi:zinc metallopeptidase [Blautia liquoris]|uniref:Zinc metallopeptidase n=1 Tax=Blautia liquoris TaxID=2779518 RepID=A0A7M2RIQ8_9FIRM|nr:zinc metallopeptidase [Blautia liquoris]QOV20213.1 zinc metallopeptidase [Blautia liquoris]